MFVDVTLIRQYETHLVEHVPQLHGFLVVDGPVKGQGWGRAGEHEGDLVLVYSYGIQRHTRAALQTFERGVYPDPSKLYNVHNN